MAHHSPREYFSGPLPCSPATAAINPAETDLTCPYGDLHSLDREDIRETAYEVFFTACRSSPGFGGGRNAITFYSQHHHHESGDSGSGPLSPNSGSGSGPGSPGGRVGSGAVVVMTPTSRIKRALGLKMIKRSPSRRMSSGGGGGNGGSSAPGSPNAAAGSYSPGLGSFHTVPASRPRRPLTSAEIMRLQMKVTEQSDNRLRKTLMRTLVGQMGKRAETIILPLELLRHLKPAEFNDTHEYHFWQRRQLKILEAGLLLHPSVPLEKSNSFAVRLREIIRSSETKAIDTSKNSETMKALCESVVSLSWRSSTGVPTDVCHWADGFPFNLHIYTCLLQAIFDFRDETLVLDEVDELVELMKKTWSTLGINRSIHNLCFTWVLFQQYVVTSQTEPDLLYAAHAMLSTEVANDAKKPDREAIYAKLLCSMLASMQGWAERRLLHYQDFFQRGNVFLIENLLPLALSASKILGEDVNIIEVTGKDDTQIMDSSGDRVDHYIRASIKSAFAKVIETGSYKSTSVEVKDEASEALLQLAKETEDLAMRERESFSPILKKWQPIAASVAAVTLHHCYGAVLKQYLAGMLTLNSESVEVLQRAGKLEKFLVQMVVEDSADGEDGGKTIVREMIPYEVDSVIMRVIRQWIDERIKRLRECFLRAKDSETWNPKSKNEPYATSVVELMKLAKETVEEFFQIPVGVTDDLVYDLAEGLEHLFQEYINFVESCGSKQSYLPSLPPLTRCNRDSKFFKLWKRAAPCSVPPEEIHQDGMPEGHHPRPSTSRGTQRLYIRLNTLHYLLSHLHSLDKTLALAPRSVSSARTRHANHQRQRSTVSSFFELSHSTIQTACQNVSEVAAYRLIFLDSNSVFYESLYVDCVANARIRPALRILKQNLTLLTAIVTDRAQALAMKSVTKATFEAYLMVLLAGGNSRVFYRADHSMMLEDFEQLKRVFCTCGEGLVTEEMVEKEAEIVEGVISLMGECTEQLMEDLSIVSCETSGIGVIASGQKLPMPPTTGRWNRADPNTILRVLCHRNDKTADQFLKKSFQLAKRK
ncbi:protein unc-13 homolog [Euphorbia lathyris]|uniref:protein unc-13 homolog n=1 Tax=Euphorbia lathyris TaxID=212925 RepID=UPI0033142487